MQLVINTKDLQDQLPFQVLKAYTSATEDGRSALNIVVFSNTSNESIMRDLLVDAIENQYNYCHINKANDEITVYTFESIKGYCYIVK